MNDEKETYFEVSYPYTPEKELALIVWCITYCKEDWSYRTYYDPKPIDHDEMITLMFKSKNDACFCKCYW